MACIFFFCLPIAYCDFYCQNSVQSVDPYLHAYTLALNIILEAQCKIYTRKETVNTDDEAGPNTSLLLAVNFFFGMSVVYTIFLVIEAALYTEARSFYSTLDNCSIFKS